MDMFFTKKNPPHIAFVTRESNGPLKRVDMLRVSLKMTGAKFSQAFVALVETVSPPKPVRRTGRFFALQGQIPCKESGHFMIANRMHRGWGLGMTGCQNDFGQWSNCRDDVDVASHWQLKEKHVFLGLFGVVSYTTHCYSDLTYIVLLKPLDQSPIRMNSYALFCCHFLTRPFWKVFLFCNFLVELKTQNWMQLGSGIVASETHGCENDGLYTTVDSPPTVVQPGSYTLWYN